MTSKEHNIELRSRILIQSLEIESTLSDWLKILFRIKQEDTKTLGNRTSAMSFKAKCDLLSDLNRIESRLYKDLIIFMELRNQLIHNLNVTSLTQALSSVNESKRLNSFALENGIKYSNQSEDDLIKLENLFHTYLMKEILKGAKNTIKEIKEQDRRELLEKVAHDVIESYDDAIDEFAIEFKKIWIKDDEERESEIDKIIMSGIRTKVKASIEKKYNIKID